MRAFYNDALLPDCPIARLPDCPIARLPKGLSSGQTAEEAPEMQAQIEQSAREAFHERMHRNYMYGLWELASQMTPTPRPKAIPYMWKWELLESILNESGEVVPIGDERRALQLFNPGLDGRWATTNNLLAAVQMLLPGEVARAHRHAPVAIRFIIEGSGAYTAVDGERVYMEPGDLVLTPSWTWHDHGNETDKRVIWMDGLDLPLVQNVEAMFFQLYEQPMFPLSLPNNNSQHLHAHAHMGPTWVKEHPAYSPLLIYAWKEARRALEELREQPGDAFDGVCLEYRHPQTGGALLPTMACFVQLIKPGQQLQAHRHTGGACYYVVEGQGESIIDGRRYRWSKGDILVVTPWALHEHANTSASDDAVLFSLHDSPVLQKLDLHREEPMTENGGHQQVIDEFRPLGD
jgi:gentisate 1,2-dioxygenase